VVGHANASDVPDEGDVLGDHTVKQLNGLDLCMNLDPLVAMLVWYFGKNGE